jgi:hypothetical protein
MDQPQGDSNKPIKPDTGPGMLSATKRKTLPNAGETTLVYVAPISDRITLAHMNYFNYFPCSLALCNSTELKRSTYVHLYEDRLEWNYPSACCSTIYDNPGVLYLDRDITEHAQVPSCCSPCCTHNSCWPTCFDLYGEVVMFSGEGRCCFLSGARNWGMPHSNTPATYGCGIPTPFCGILCCKNQWVFIPHLVDAQELVKRVRVQRKLLGERGLARNCSCPIVSM